MGLTDNQSIDLDTAELFTLGQKFSFLRLDFNPLHTLNFEISSPKCYISHLRSKETLALTTKQIEPKLHGKTF